MKKNEFTHSDITKELLIEEWVKNRMSQQEIADKHHTNLALQANIDKDVYTNLTVLDKALILLQLKAVSVEPDFKLKIKCEDATEEFTEGVSTDELQYCADCGGTDIVTMSFSKWQSLYEETTGLIYLELK